MATQALQGVGDIGGIGSHGYFATIDTGWTVTYDDGVAVWRPNAITGIMVDSGAELADADVKYYSKVLSITGGAVSKVYKPASADAQITLQWEYFSSKDTSYDGTGDRAGGTWVALGADAATAATLKIDPSDTDHYAMKQIGSQIRLRMDIVDAGSNAVAAGLVTAAVNAINHISTGAYIQISMDKTAELNASLSSITGIGADPS